MWNVVFFVLFSFTTLSYGSTNSGNYCNPISVTFAENHFMHAFFNKFNPASMTSESKQVLDCLQRKTSVKIKEIPNCKVPRYCLLCRVAMRTLTTTYKKHQQSSIQELKPTMSAVAQGLCEVGKFPKEYCNALVKLYIDSILEILKRKPDVTPDDICSMAFAPIGCTESHAKVRLLNAVNVSEENFRSQVAVTRENVQPIKILHITDVHYDPNYVSEKDSDKVLCKKSLACCRNTTSGESKSANYWGDYGFCDTPKVLLEKSLQQIAARHKDVKLLYLTGDILRHHLVEINYASLEKDLEYVFNLFMKTFQNIPIIFAPGNHDTDVFGMYSSSLWEDNNAGQKKVYNFFKKWIPKLWQNGKLTKKPKSIEWPEKGEGYYTVRLKERLRLVVLNSNVPYNYNWWLLVEHFYGGQLQWLQDVLCRAETNHEKVHILSHIPPNHHSLLPDWSQQYQRIVERYKNTIQAQFNGHSHFDEFTLFYDSSKHPISVAWNGGSLTPHTYHNPNYHVVTVEPKYFSVSVRESYTFNLNEANKSPSKDPQWYLLYNMTSTYNLKDLTLPSLDGFVKKMAKDESLTTMFLTNKVKKGPRVHKISTKCKKEAICSILITNTRNKANCENVLKTLTWGKQDTSECMLNE